MRTHTGLDTSTFDRLPAPSAAIDPVAFGGVGPRERPYLTSLYRILGDPTGLRELEARIGTETKRFVREHGDALRPSWARALATLTKTILGVTVPLALAWWLASAGTWWPSVILVPLAGVALYGATSIFHDTVHSSFFPSTRANRILGSLLGPIFMLDFGSFRESHMGHHRHSQSVERDPKYPKLPWANPATADAAVLSRGRGGLLTRTFVRGWLGLATRIATGPSGLRAVFYVATIVLFGGPTALLFGGEVALLERDWTKRGPWISLVGTLALYGSLVLASPSLGVLAILAAWFAMSCFFTLFLTHLSPYQLYLVEGRNTAPKLMALNVSDIRLGAFTWLFGNRFSEYHAAHHLLSFVPCYRLDIVGRWLDERFDSIKAPVLRPLTAADATLLGDAIVATVTRPPAEALPQWRTPSGHFMRRTAVPGRPVRQPEPRPDLGDLAMAAASASHMSLSRSCWP